ncbi:Mur ligase [Zychaea mexicana]|uniref:Mur ligase n=1 Tax=Zychaea mexicana TaxID=64656 RepID=UPI0022FE5C82|nr:Mur ligase [Zychaea mexicana]KAI9479598.1 Mur ligase [Zychaea mexicana]
MKKPSALNDLNIIYISGIKGKGSTSAFTQSILLHLNSSNDKQHQQPIKTGLFTSPHLITIRERIRINGVPISEDLFAKYNQDVWQRLKSTINDRHEDWALQIQKGMATDDSNPLELSPELLFCPEMPSYFIYMFLVAVHAFLQEKVDVAIIEVGVRGEHGVANIIEKPIVCGITALGIDHVDVLGHTIEEITWDQAGIIKPDTPVVTFEQIPQAMAIIQQRAQEKGSLVTVLYPKDIKQLDAVTLGLDGTHQMQNALMAIEMSRIWLEKCRGTCLDKNAVPEEFKAGLAQVVWPGRGQRVNVKDTRYRSQANQVIFYLDGAHTMESIQVCVDWFQGALKKDEDNEPVKRILLFNCTNGRDGTQLLELITDIQSNVHFDHVMFSCNTAFRQEHTTASTDESVSMHAAMVDMWKKRNPSFDAKNIHQMLQTAEDAVEWIIDYSKTHKEKIQVLTTGSLILVGHVLAVLGIPVQ